MNPFKRISLIGVQEDMPEKLVDRYQLTNWVAILLFLGTLQYIFLGLTTYPQILGYVLLEGTIQISVLVFNFFGRINISRFLLTLYPPLGAALLHLSLLQPGEAPFTSLSIMSLCLFIIGWLLYDYKERMKIFFATIWSFAFFLLPFIVEGSNTVEQDMSMFKEGADFYMLIITAFGGLVVCMFLIQNRNKKENDKNTQLLNEVAQKNDEAEQKSQQLNTMLSEVKKSQEKDRQRQWMSENLSAISSLIRSEDSSSELYDRVISQTVKNLKANQGALYILDDKDEEPVLDMKACYAYNRKKFVEKQIAVGQGLVGQCYLEKEYIYLTEIPQNYVTITSGLGEATPTALILVPLIYNEEVVGIIELASFTLFEAHQIEFLQTMGTSLANFIINIRMNEKTRLLLEKSQEQAEQLQANEEELRQNMEEMNATQEELQRELKRYKELLEEKEALLLEYQTQV